MPVRLTLKPRCFVDGEAGALVGNHVLVVNKGDAYVVDAETCRRVHEVADYIGFYQHDRDKALILTDNSVLLLDRLGKLTELNADSINRGSVKDMAFHESGLLAVSTYDAVSVYSTRNGDKVAEFKLDAPIVDIMFASSGEGSPVLVVVGAESYPRDESYTELRVYKVNKDGAEQAHKYRTSEYGTVNAYMCGSNLVLCTNRGTWLAKIDPHKLTIPEIRKISDFYLLPTTDCRYLMGWVKFTSRFDLYDFGGRYAGYGCTGELILISSLDISGRHAIVADDDFVVIAEALRKEYRHTVALTELASEKARGVNCFYYCSPEGLVVKECEDYMYVAGRKGIRKFRVSGLCDRWSMCRKKDGKIEAVPLRYTTVDGRGRHISSNGKWSVAVSEDGELLYVARLPNEIEYSADCGEVIVYATSCAIYALDPKTGAVLWSMPVLNAEFVECSSRFVAVSTATAVTVGEVSKSRFKPVSKVGCSSALGASPSPSGKTVAVATRTGLSLVDVESGEEVLFVTGDITCACWVDDRTLATVERIDDVTHVIRLHRLALSLSSPQPPSPPSPRDEPSSVSKS